MIFTLQRLGLALVLIGVVVLASLYFLRFTFVNALLIAPLCIIIAGLTVYVWGQKRTSRY